MVLKQKISNLEVLRTKDLTYSINWKHYEEVERLFFPPLYKVFLETFHLDRELHKLIDFCNLDLHLADGDYLLAWSSSIDEYFLEVCGGLDRFYPIDKTSAVIEEICKIDIMLEFVNIQHMKENYLPIGVSGNKIVFVGTGPDNMDEIFSFNWGCDQNGHHGNIRVIRIAKNIFEHMKNLNYEWQDIAYLAKNLDYNYVLQQIHRKWGQEVWTSFVTHDELRTMNDKAL